MKRLVILLAPIVLLIIVLVSLVGCQNDPATTFELPESEVVAEPTAVPPEPTEPPEPPEPTPLPEPTSEPEPALISSAEEMVGIWLGTVAGEKGYVMYTADGRFTVALVQDDLGSAPRVSGDYWFEDGNIHLRDLENAGHWVDCDAEIVGVYEVVVLVDKSLQFQTVEDDCNEGGFTRNYIFANMVQEWIAEPVALEVADEGNPELAAALQAVVDQ